MADDESIVDFASRMQASQAPQAPMRADAALTWEANRPLAYEAVYQTQGEISGGELVIHVPIPDKAVYDVTVTVRKAKAAE